MQQKRHWILAAAAGIVIGGAVGLIIGWWLWPVTYTNTSPAALRDDLHDEYVLIIATAYEVEGDAAHARQRLAQLNPEEPAAPLLELSERLARQGGRDRDVLRLTRLAEALGGESQADASASAFLAHLLSYRGALP